MNKNLMQQIRELLRLRRANVTDPFVLLESINKILDNPDWVCVPMNIHPHVMLDAGVSREAMRAALITSGLGQGMPDAVGRRASMLEAAKPLITWMNENCHPPCSARVDQNTIILSEGVTTNTQDHEAAKRLVALEQALDEFDATQGWAANGCIRERAAEILRATQDKG